MSRSGYSDDCDGWALIRWRGEVSYALRGARGQKFLAELRDALDAMTEKRLIANELQQDGCYCTLGVIGAARGVELGRIDAYDYEQVAKSFGIAEAMAQEIMFWNDESPWYEDSVETPEQRWKRMRRWVQEQIQPPLSTT